MSKPKIGDLVELWEIVDGSPYAILLRGPHDYDPAIDLPPHYVENGAPHRTFDLIASIPELDSDGRRVHQALMKPRDAD